jgi:hypothetical protein
MAYLFDELQADVEYWLITQGSALYWTQRTGKGGSPGVR